MDLLTLAEPLEEAPCRACGEVVYHEPNGFGRGLFRTEDDGWECPNAAADGLGLHVPARDLAIRTLMHGQSVANADELPDQGEPGRYLLVEESRYDSSWWLTSWDDPADAADYHDSQENPDDWNVRCLIDLDAGTEKEAVTTTSFA